MSANSSAVHARRSPLLALWSREDPRTAVIDFLPTSTIAVLAVVAKPLRDAQSRLLLTAIKRRGKTAVPNSTTRALLDTLVIGEPHYFGEKWERGYSPQWYRASAAKLPLYRYSSVKECPDGGYFLELSGDGFGHKGFARSLRAKNLLVTRLRVTMSYQNFGTPGFAVGYVMLCGRHTYGIGGALGDFMGGPRFNKGGNGVVSLTWLQYVQEQEGDNAVRMLVEVVERNTPYIVDATFNHESATSCSGTVDISVNGQMVAEGISIVYSPLRSIALYNFGPGVSMIGGIEIWSERAAPNQVWKSDLGDY